MTNFGFLKAPVGITTNKDRIVFVLDNVRITLKKKGFFISYSLQRICSQSIPFKVFTILSLEESWNALLFKSIVCSDARIYLSIKIQLGSRCLQ
jgi:hypothetical protein